MSETDTLLKDVPTTTISTDVVVCSEDQLLPGRGVAALLPDDRQVALFLLPTGELHAICNIDPIARAAVMSRGLVGDRKGEPVAMSPIGKEAYSLLDGRCLDDETHSVKVYDVRVEDGEVIVKSIPRLA